MTTFFPAPLSSFEYFLLLDNRPSHPLDFFVHVHVNGVVDSSVVETAFEEALQHHPLLCATIRRNGQRCKWVAADLDPKVRFAERESAGAGFSKTPIDLEHEAGLRCTVIRDETGAEFVFQFQHATTDGLGAFGFVTDFLLCCGRLSDPSLPEPHRRQERLTERYSCGYHTGTLWDRVYKSVTGILMTREFLGARICPLTSDCPDIALPRTNADYPRYLSRTLTQAETQSLKSSAADSEVSLNTLMIGAAFQAFEKFRKRGQGYDAQGYMRIAIPGNLRSTHGNEEFPAGNFFSMTFPTRNAEQIESEDLLQSLHREMRAARENYYFSTFAFILKWLGRLPGVLRRLVDVQKCQATTLLTNLGPALYEFPRAEKDDPITAGGMSVERVEIVPPMRPFQTFAMSTLEYAGCQTITLTYDPRIHDVNEASGMLDDYVARLRDAI